MTLESIRGLLLASLLLMGCPSDQRSPSSVEPSQELPAAKAEKPEAESSLSLGEAAVQGFLESSDAFDRLTVVTRLRQGDSSFLEESFSSYQSQRGEDPQVDEDLRSAYRAFNIADPSIRPRLDQWLSEYPQSPYAHLAMARHFNALAWKARGSKWSRETSQEQFREMNRLHGESMQYLSVALEEEPGLIDAYELWINLQTGRGDTGACRQIADKALELAPAHWGIHAQLIRCLQPRWGGSYPAVDQVAQEAQRYLDRNPKLATLAGLADLDRAKLADSSDDEERAVELCSRALESGEIFGFYETRGRAKYNLERYQDALSDYDRAKRIAPLQPNVLISRARALEALGRLEEALEERNLAKKLDPTHSRLGSLDKRLSGSAVVSGHQLYSEKRWDPALAWFDRSIEIDGRNVEAYYWRARTHIMKRDLVHGRQDLEKAIEVDPRHFESYRNLDWVLAQERDWDAILDLWEQFLRLEPDHAGAYLERAGTYRHSGDTESSRADLERACELGSEKACQLSRLQ